LNKKIEKTQREFLEVVANDIEDLETAQSTEESDSQLDIDEKQSI
jgi:hypothetical protein